MVHNLYQQGGGEDFVFKAETELLRNAGHDVETLEVSNDSIRGVFAMSGAALSAIYNTSRRAELAERLRMGRFDVLHAHNFFPQLSPSIFDACLDVGVASVLTLHNFRLTCAAGTLFRDGVVCQRCVGRMPLPAIVHRCYRGSFPGSTSVAAMIAVHKAAGTWRRKVDRFIALSAFATDIFAEAGMPKDRIRLKPNYVPDRGDAAGSNGRDGFVFVGRLSPEKGCTTLVEAWRKIDQPLTIIGDGPELERLRARAPANVTFAGRLDSSIVHQAMAAARAVIVPSQCFETFGLVAVEGMMVGTPVVASRIGALPEIIDDGVTGLLFEPGDPGDLQRAVLRLAGDDARVELMGGAARRRYEDRYTPARNLGLLEDIYAEAIRSKHARHE